MHATHLKLPNGYAKLLQADLYDGRFDGLAVPCFQGERLADLDARAKRADGTHI